MKLDIKKTNIKYNNYSSLPFEMQLLKAMPESLDTFEPSYASSMVKNGNDFIPNRFSEFDKRRISQPKKQ